MKKAYSEIVADTLDSVEWCLTDKFYEDGMTVTFDGKYYEILDLDDTESYNTSTTLCRAITSYLSESIRSHPYLWDDDSLIYLYNVFTRCNSKELDETDEKDDIMVACIQKYLSMLPIKRVYNILEMDGPISTYWEYVSIPVFSKEELKDGIKFKDSVYHTPMIETYYSSGLESTCLKWLLAEMKSNPSTWESESKELDTLVLECRQELTQKQFETLIRLEGVDGYMEYNESGVLEPHTSVEGIPYEKLLSNGRKIIEFLIRIWDKLPISYV